MFCAGLCVVGKTWSLGEPELHEDAEGLGQDLGIALVLGALPDQAIEPPQDESPVSDLGIEVTCDRGLDDARLGEAPLRGVEHESLSKLRG